MNTQDLMDDVANRMSYHAPTPGKVRLHEAMRGAFIDLAQTVIDSTPQGRHQSLALTALQEALMWTNAAIAVDGQA